MVAAGLGIAKGQQPAPPLPSHGYPGLHQPIQRQNWDLVWGRCATSWILTPIIPTDSEDERGGFPTQLQDSSPQGEAAAEFPPGLRSQGII